MFRIVVFVSAALTFPLKALAEDSCVAQDECIEIGSWDLGLAVGWGQKTNPLRDFDDIPVYFIPTIAYYGERFFFDNGNFGYTLVEHPHYSVNLVTSYSLDRAYFYRWDPSNIFISHSTQQLATTTPMTHLITTQPDYRFNDLESRHFTMLGGAETFFYTAAGTLRLAYAHDMFDVHQGSEGQVNWSYGWQINDLYLNLSLVFDWKSSNVIGYYYGVRPSENAYWSQQYHAKSGWNRGIELTSRYTINANWDVLVALRYRQLADEIAASPLLDEDYSSTYFFGAAYRF
ncbi:MipA/OmpV family protein [Shewanella sp. A25]|nr:MipA/OmpV family protein [Shewanella shenzhenensis]